MYFSTCIPYFFKALALCLLLLVGVKEGYGQRVYADVQRSGVTGSLLAKGEVLKSDRSVNAIYDDFTTLKASSLVTATTAWQQLIFPNSIFPSGTTIYIKLNITNGLLQLLGSSLLVSAYSGSRIDYDGISVSTQFSIFTSIDGSTFLAVSANDSFNSIRITLKSPTLLGENVADIYYAFYELPNKDCAEVIGTSTANTGVSLLGSVTDPLKAIDNNLETYSTVNGGLLGLGSTISQTAYFANLSNSGDAATVTFSIPPAVLSLGLFNNVTIKTYNGNNQTPTSVTPLNSLLSLDLLGLLGNGERYTVSFVPNQQFDRIEVSVATGVSLLSKFQIHEIQRTPAKPAVPTVYPNVMEVCYGSFATLTATATSVGSMLRWYDQVNDGTMLQEGSPYTTPPIVVTPGDTAFYYVAAAWNSGCAAESERVKIGIITNSLPTITVTAVDVCETQTSAILPYTATNNPITYSITWGDSSFINVSDATLTPDNILLNIPDSTLAGTYTGILKVKNNNGCESEDVSFTVTVHPKPPPPNLNITTNSQY